jgi:sugar phosphate isomerase/epimerase
MNTFGWCRGIEDAEMLKQAGCDYMEGELTALKLEDERQYRELLPSFMESPLPVRAFNMFLPGDLKVVGPEVDEARIDRYLAKAADALHRIGARIVVLGSGKSRTIPEGWEQKRAEEQFVRLLNRAADELAGTGVVLAIEPLFRKGTNLINSVAEASRVAAMVNRRPIRILADLFHMQEENESLDTIIAHKQWLAHIHVADTGRLSPGTGGYPSAEFADRLKQAGYRGMISAECTVRDNNEFTDGVAFMRRTFG